MEEIPKKQYDTPLQSVLLDQPLEYKSLIKRISDETESHRSTVWKWVHGIQRPTGVKKTIVANIVGVPKETLWPDE